MNAKPGNSQFLLAAGMLLIAVGVVYSHTLLSMVSVWASSSTFVHGFLILPLSAYLVWRKRDEWLSTPARPSLLGLFFLALSVLAWSVADAVAVQVVAHFAVVAMLVSVVWTVFGFDVVRVLHFPLLYAFFAVPFGEFLIPPLMDWTATFAVSALQVTGIPVLREGNYFALPSGNFHVVEACSGIRYLVVTLVLGLYFAHEYFASQRKRLIFIAAAAAAVIVANGVRAYVVVLIAHYSNMKYGTGQDHIYLGYAIFLVTIFALFWIGRRYEDVSAVSQDARPVATVSGPERLDTRLALLFMLSLFVLISGPRIPVGTDATDIGAELHGVQLPKAANAWRGPDAAILGYRPSFFGFTSTQSRRYSRDAQAVELHVIAYSKQKQGTELISFRNHVFDPDVWRSVPNVAADKTVNLEDADLAFNMAAITDGRDVLRVGYWYDIGGHVALSPTRVKLLQFWNRLTGNVGSDAIVVLVEQIDDSATGASLLEAFARDHYESLRSCIRSDTADPERCVGTLDNAQGR